MITLVPITTRWQNTSLGSSDPPKLQQTLSAPLAANGSYLVQTSPDTLTWTTVQSFNQPNMGTWNQTIDPAAKPVAYRVVQN